MVEKYAQVGLEQFLPRYHLRLSQSNRVSPGSLWLKRPHLALPALHSGRDSSAPALSVPHLRATLAPVASSYARLYRLPHTAFASFAARDRPVLTHYSKPDRAGAAWHTIPGRAP